MKRLRRWLFNSLAGVSLPLCLATAVVWIRSYSHEDDWRYNLIFAESRQVTIRQCITASSYGLIVFAYSNRQTNAPQEIEDLTHDPPDRFTHSAFNDLPHLSLSKQIFSFHYYSYFQSVSGEEAWTDYFRSLTIP